MSSPSTPTSIATRLRDARETANFSQIELAAQFGVSRRALQLWESGERVPQPRHRRLILAFIAEVADGQAA